jgi:tetratricopeptide (TPR) repeat protein
MALADVSLAQSQASAETSPETGVVQSTSSESAGSELSARIASLIQQLGNSNYHARLNARWELEQIGLAAFEQLREAAQSHPDPQIERAARYIVKSQDVVWSLETDSVEVRELLKNYNTLEAVERDTLLQQLAEERSADAWLALGRVARYESSDLLSKSAALYLMEGMIDPAKSFDSTLPKSLRITIGPGVRASTRWLNELLEQLTTSPAPSSNNQKSITHSSDISGAPDMLEVWRTLLADEHASLLAQSGHQPESEDADLELPEFLSALGGSEADGTRMQSIVLALRLYRWVGTWTTQRVGRTAALELVRPSLQLVGPSALAIRNAASWALEANLPELLPELASQRATDFATEPELGYYLAESYLRMSQPEQANAAAEEASAAVAAQLAELRNLRNLNLDEIQANRHYILANQLEQRGLFEWAEREFLKALEFELPGNTEFLVRDDLAQFYWFGDEPDKAAAVLQPLADKYKDDANADLPKAPGDFSDPDLTVSNYFFYLGLAALEQGDRTAAAEHFRSALNVHATFANPDIIIAMRQLADEEPVRSYFQQQFLAMCDDYRARVAEAEELLSRSSDRRQRANAAPLLANACNQLAWLLGKCESSPSEAINLSLRSLELVPDEPAYLDTLARCYYSAGQIKKAIRVQKTAVRLAPHERQMKAQLQEFEAALLEDPTQSPPTPNESTPNESTPSGSP